MLRAFRRVVPNVQVPIRHVEPGLRLWVRARQHAGLLARGATSYEPGYVRVLRALVRQGDHAVDVGANLGFYTTLFARWTGPAGAVTAYEPDPDLYVLLERNVRANRLGNVILRRSAASDRSGEAIFSRDLATGFTGHLGPGVTRGAVWQGRGELATITVATVRLDQDARRPVDLLKVDAEGSHATVLDGAAAILRDDRPVVLLELDLGSDDPSQDLRKSAMDLLARRGYVVWDLEQRKLATSHPPRMLIGVSRDRLGEFAPRLRTMRLPLPGLVQEARR